MLASFNSDQARFHDSAVREKLLDKNGSVGKVQVKQKHTAGQKKNKKSLTFYIDTNILRAIKKKMELSKSVTSCV